MARVTHVRCGLRWEKKKLFVLSWCHISLGSILFWPSVSSGPHVALGSSRRNAPASNVSRGGVQQDRASVADTHEHVVSGKSMQAAFEVLEGSGARRTRAFPLSSHCTLTLPVIWTAGWPGASRREGVPRPRDRPAKDYLLPEG